MTTRQLIATNYGSPARTLAQWASSMNISVICNDSVLGFTYNNEPKQTNTGI